MILLERSSSAPGTPSRISIGPLHDQTLLAAGIGLLLFPGLGTLAWTLAAGISGLLGNPRTHTTEEDPDAVSLDLFSQIHDVLNTPLPKATIQPLVEVRYASDSRVKRAALDLICREPSPGGVSLVRGFLADPDADVRALAAVAISRLENNFSMLLEPFEAQIEFDPEDPKPYAAIGHLYYEYSVAGNTASRRFGLLRARENLERAVSLGPSNADAFLDLAETLVELGEYREALEMVKRLRSEHPECSKSYLLGLEIAFRDRNFDTVHTLAEQASLIWPEDSELFPFISAWLTVKDPNEGRSR